MRSDIFGYYRVGDKTTYSKYEASLWGRPTWHFNDEVYSAIDWRIDPPIELTELYNKRARQIRAEYDYVVIMYSGGIDSHNVVKSFINAGCKIDEIASLWDYGVTGDRSNVYNIEIFNVVLPTIQAWQKEGVKFKYRIIDHEPLYKKIFESKVDYELMMNCYPSVTNTSRGYIREVVEDYKKIIESGKKLCIVWGKEKTFIKYEDGQYYCDFVDEVDDAVGPNFQAKQGRDGWFDEYFYWSPSSPLIPVKIAQIIKKFVTRVNDPYYYEKKSGVWGYNSFLNSYLRRDVYYSLIYPYWNLKTFSVGKVVFYKPNRKSPIGPKDYFIIKDNSDSINYYKQNFQHYIDTLKKADLFINNQPAPIRSKRYWL
jgi:hypothetical protein